MPGGEYRSQMEMGKRVLGLSCDGGAKGGFSGAPVLTKCVEGAEFILKMGVRRASARELSEDGGSLAELAGGDQCARVGFKNAIWKSAMSRARSCEISLKKRNGARVGSSLLIGQREILLCAVIVGIRPQRQRKFMDARRILAKTDKHGTERAMALLGSRVQADNLGEAGLRGVKVATAERGQSCAIGSVGLAQWVGLRAGRQYGREDEEKQQSSA